jgi:hypothetical protein
MQKTTYHVYVLLNIRSGDCMGDSEESSAVLFYDVLKSLILQNVRPLSCP